MKLNSIRKNMVMWVLLCCATVTTMSPAYAMHVTHTSPGLTYSTDVKSIETSHFILRPFTNDDVHYIFEHWTKDSDIVKQLGWTHPERIEFVEDWLKNSSNFKWCITVKDNNTPVGTIGICSVLDPHTCELTFAVAKEYQNRGIMTEALSNIRWYLLAKAHFTTNTDFTKLMAYTDKANSASIRVLSKNRFECVGHSTTTDTPDRIMYQITQTYQEFLDIEF